MACDVFAATFGVSRSWLEALHYVEIRGEEVWAMSAPIPERLAGRRAPGLRALRSQPAGLKPTSTFLVHLGPRITRSRIEVDRKAAHRLASGQPLASDREDGYVAISYKGDILGCGEVRRGQLRALIPTGRRRELLEALTDDT